MSKCWFLIQTVKSSSAEVCHFWKTWSDALGTYILYTFSSTLNMCLFSFCNSKPSFSSHIQYLDKHFVSIRFVSRFDSVKTWWNLRLRWKTQLVVKQINTETTINALFRSKKNHCILWILPYRSLAYISSKLQNNPQTDWFMALQVTKLH